MTRDEAIEAGAKAIYQATWRNADDCRAESAAVLDAIGWRPESVVQAEALREFAGKIRRYYPEAVFIPPTREWLAQVHEFCKQWGHTLDAISAHSMRNVARMADADADLIERGDA